MYFGPPKLEILDPPMSRDLGASMCLELLTTMSFTLHIKAMTLYQGPIMYQTRVAQLVCTPTCNGYQNEKRPYQTSTIGVRAHIKSLLIERIKS